MPLNKFFQSEEEVFMSTPNEETPPEVEKLVAAACECCEGGCGMLPFSYRYYYDGDEGNEDISIVVEIAPRVGEMYAGEHDGQEIFDPVNIDLWALGKLFDSSEEGYGFDYVAPMGNEGDHISLCRYGMWLKFFLGPFPDDDPDWVFDTTRKGPGAWRRKGN